jgi:hypothetical protein
MPVSTKETEHVAAGFTPVIRPAVPDAAMIRERGKIMAQDVDILWGLYLENCNQGRSHEAMRATATNFMLVTTAGMLGVVALDHKLNFDDLPLTIFIVLLGAFGAVIVAKHYERVQLHMERARVIRSAIEELLPSTHINSLNHKANETHKAKWPWLHDVRLNYLWIGIQICIVLVGAMLTAMAIWYPMAP